MNPRGWCVFMKRRTLDGIITIILLAGIMLQRFCKPFYSPVPEDENIIKLQDYCFKCWNYICFT